MCKILLILLLTAHLAAQKLPASELLKMAGQANPPTTFQQALLDTLGVENIQKGAAVIGEGPDFLWTVESAQTPTLVVDEVARPAMRGLKGTNLWFLTGKLKTGAAHEFHYVVAGAVFGGKNDVPAYGPDSYAQSGVPQGKVSDKLIHASKIYEGMNSDYWIYVPAQYDPARPAALMVWQDGEGFFNRDGGSRLLNVTDNLIQQKKIPVMIHVMISPGTPSKTWRSLEYDTVSDRYARFLGDEILAEVQSRYNIRRDGYSRAIAGQSSGGICAFNVAWQQPGEFSRVLSRIGSFTSIQWRPAQNLEGGNVYPFKIRKEPKRNIRVWLDDGSNDLENDHGSWPLQNIQMANSLKMKGYDFHFSFGNGTHSTAHGNAELPEALTWLWRDYDPAKSDQAYEMEAAEKAKPLFRVRIANRDH